jgi:hypothetical protein
MIIRYLGIILIFTLVQLSSCKSNTEPIEYCKRPMEMAWTVDTLSYPGSIQTLVLKMVGVSNNDLYAMGACDAAGGRIYHFNGVKWSSYNVAQYIYGFWVYDMIAFNWNNIVGVGTRGDDEKILAFYYDGLTWKYELAGDYIQGALYAVDGENSNNIYACGKDGLVYHFDGMYWKKEIIKLNIPSNSFYRLSSVAVYKDEAWLIGSVTNNNVNYYRSFLIKGKVNNWAVVDSIDTGRPIALSGRGLTRIFKGNNNKLYSSGTRGFYYWSDAGWQLLYNDLYNSDFYVYNDNYIISFGGINSPTFYDGVQWKQFFDKLPVSGMISFRYVWFDSKEMFIVGHLLSEYPQKTIILHGK